MFKLEVNTGNAAFCDPITGEEDKFWEMREISRLMAEVSRKMENGKESGSIIDINGNKVGEWKLE